MRLTGACAFRLAKSSLAALAGSIRPLRASLAASERLLESLERPKSSDKAAGPLARVLRAAQVEHFGRAWPPRIACSSPSSTPSQALWASLAALAGSIWPSSAHCLALAGSIWLPTTASTISEQKNRLAYRRSEHRSGCFIVLLSSPPCLVSSTSCLLYTSPSPRDQRGSRMPSSA